MTMIRFGLSPGLSAPCPPLDELQHLIRAGMLPHTCKLWGRLPDSDCHLVAEVLSRELHDAGALDWAWVTGICRDVGAHSWNESRGIVIDASHGSARPVIVAPSHLYRLVRDVINVRRVQTWN
jgi:hypothetical protein